MARRVTGHSGSSTTGRELRNSRPELPATLLVIHGGETTDAERAGQRQQTDEPRQRKLTAGLRQPGAARRGVRALASRADRAIVVRLLVQRRLVPPGFDASVSCQR